MRPDLASQLRMHATGDLVNPGTSKVFIAYSRADAEFADELTISLQDKGHEVLIDREAIQGGEEWRERLGRLILNCDTFLLVLSDASASSEVTAWELNESNRLSKRLIVVVPGELSPGMRPPLLVARTNWIYCYNNPDVPGSNRTAGFIELDKALRNDLSWLREGTYLQEQAQRWISRGTTATSGYLLRGEVLADAIAWVNRTPRGERIPEDVAKFIGASQAMDESQPSSMAPVDLPPKGYALPPNIKKGGIRRWFRGRPKSVLVSYRRSDTEMVAGRIYDTFRKKYGAKRVFFDLDTIPAGIDFVQFVVNHIEQCAALVVLIGPNWTKDNRLSNERDNVRLELLTARRLGVAVYPLLIGGATMPDEYQLPPELSWLPSINATPIDVGRDYHFHMTRLMSFIKL